MGPRNLLILFFSTVAVSLVILIIFFSLFFKNVDLNFNTRLPESAPDIGNLYGNSPAMSQESKANGLSRSTVNVPPELAPSTQPHEPDKAEAEISDNELPPVSDDVILDDLPPVPNAKAPTTEKSTKTTGVPTPSQPTRTVERKPTEQPVMEPLIPIESMPSNSPPVPQQGQAKPETNYKVVLGNYGSKDEADAAAAKAAASGVVPIVKQTGNRYSVQLGSFSNRQNAESLAGKVGANVQKAN